MADDGIMTAMRIGARVLASALLLAATPAPAIERVSIEAAGATLADGVVVGSRIIEEVEQSSPDEAPRRVTALLADIRQAMDAGVR